MTEEASVPVSFTRKRSSRATARTKTPTESTWRSAASSWCSSTVPGNSSSADRVRRISARISSRRSSIGTSWQERRVPFEHFGVWPAEGTLLGGNGDGQERCVQGEEDQRGEPRAMRQGNGEHLEGQSEVVRMPQEAIGAARHWRRARNDDDPRVPTSPERRDGPPAERLGAEGHGQRNQPWSPRKRPLQDEHLGRARDRKEGVDHDHDDVDAAPRLDTARRQNLAGIPARDEKLRAPLVDEKAQKP